LACCSCCLAGGRRGCCAWRGRFCCAHELLEVGARFPRVRLASERTVAMRGKTDGRRAVVVGRLRDFKREVALAAVRSGSLDQGIGGCRDRITGVRGHPGTRALPPDVALCLAGAGQRRRGNLHHIGVDLSLRRAAGGQHAKHGYETLVHHWTSSFFQSSARRCVIQDWTETVLAWFVPRAWHTRRDRPWPVSNFWPQTGSACNKKGSARLPFLLPKRRSQALNAEAVQRIGAIRGNERIE